MSEWMRKEKHTYTHRGRGRERERQRTSVRNGFDVTMSRSIAVLDQQMHVFATTYIIITNNVSHQLISYDERRNKEEEEGEQQQQMHSACGRLNDSLHCIFLSIQKSRKSEDTRSSINSIVPYF